MESLVTLFLFLAVILFGIWLNDRAWNGQVYVYVGSDRSPAGVRTISDYSSVDRAALYRSAQAQLMAYAEVFSANGEIGLQLGHPLVERHGGRDFGCQIRDRSGIFDRMELVFSGVGITDSGESPRITVDTECSAQADLNKLATVWIPFNTIRASRSKDQRFPAGQSKPLNVHLDSIPDQWPESWVLWSVKLYRAADPEDSFFVGADQLRDSRPDLLSFKNQN